MKKTRRILTILFAAMLLVSCLAFSAMAKTEKNKLEYLNYNCNIVVQVVYDTPTKPDIVITSPSGAAYSESNTESEHYADEKAIIFYIPDAQYGQWYISYDSAYVGHLTVDIMEYSRNISIESFKIKNISGSNAEVSFKTDFPRSISYKYEISAVTLDQNGNVEGKRLLTSGNANSGINVNKNVNLSSLASYGEYYLMLDVYYEDYDAEVSDNALSSKFEFNNTNSYDPITGYKVYFNTATGEMAIDWSSVYIYGASNYNVAVEGDGELLYTHQHAGNERRAEMTLNPDHKEYKVSLSYVRYGVYSQISVVTFKPDAAGLTIVTEELTSSSQAEISYSVTEKQDATVVVNGGQGEKVMLEGSGSFTVALKEGYNDLTVNRQISDNVTLVSQKRIYSDRFAPILTFFENLDYITTAEDSFTVVGETEAGSTVTVNGSAQSIEADGSFAISLGLRSGSNVFEFVAVDAAGNRTVRSIGIVCSGEGIKDDSAFDWVLLIIIAAVALLVIALVVTVIVLAKKKKFNLTAVLALVTAVCAIGSIVLAVIALDKNAESEELNKIISGEKFFELAEESADKAYAAIISAENAKKEAESFVTYVWLAAGATVILLAAVFASRKLIGGKNGTKNAKNGTKNGKAQQKTNVPKAEPKAEPKEESKAELQTEPKEEPKVDPNPPIDSEKQDDNNPTQEG